jgi:hypothetical protein
MIKPIETRYKGYRFRSRLEARWAVFFDSMGIEWDYEVEGYDLGKRGWYLPDFRVVSPCYPDFYHLIEIKGQTPSKEEIRKIAEVNIKQAYDEETDRFYASCNFLFVGMPDMNTPCIESYRDAQLGDGLVIGKPRENLAEITMFLLDHRYKTVVDHFWRVQQAILAARSARFEFGERGRAALIRDRFFDREFV